MYRINFVFSKKNAMKFISHLDLLRLLTRAFRRAGIPLKMTEGFSPHPKISIAKALKLGVESEQEEAQILLKEMMPAERFIAAARKELPEGIEIRQAQLRFIPK
ncbi:MAG: TIGR03936 family radical SAM-associated protein [Candidatus Omnitrophota bacterium]|jgi:radical SAM-linked protein